MAAASETKAKTSAGGMQIFVKTLTGKTVTIDCDADDVVFSIKAKIYHKEGINPGMQRLIFIGKDLDDDKQKISFYNIQRATTLHLIVRKAFDPDDS